METRVYHVVLRLYGRLVELFCSKSIQLVVVHLMGIDWYFDNFVAFFSIKPAIFCYTDFYGDWSINGGLRF